MTRMKNKHGLGNVIADVSFSLDLPEGVVAILVEDDDTREAALTKIEERVKEEPFQYADYMTAGEPEVEVDG